MFSKPYLLSFIGSSLAHGALLLGMGGLYTQASVQVQPAPTSMELFLSVGESSQGLGKINLSKKSVIASEAKQSQNLEKASEIASPPSETLNDKKIEKAPPNKETKEEPISQARKVPGTDIGAVHSGSSLKTHGPCIVKNFPPKYPRAARRQGLEGTVLLKVSISKTGRAQNIEIQQSSGSPLLDKAATKAVQEWLFYPAKKAGLNIPSQLLVPVEFQIKG